MEKLMVRFGKQKNNRKDTMVTFRKDDLIFFGVARCNVKVGDKFDRELGKKIALSRAEKALVMHQAGKASFTSQEVKLSQVSDFVGYGCIPVVEIKELLQYFHKFCDRS